MSEPSTASGQLAVFERPAAIYPSTFLECWHDSRVQSPIYRAHSTNADPGCEGERIPSTGRPSTQTNPTGQNLRRQGPCLLKNRSAPPRNGREAALALEIWSHSLPLFLTTGTGFFLLGVCASRLLAFPLLGFHLLFLLVVIVKTMRRGRFRGRQRTCLDCGKSEADRGQCCSEEC